MGSGPVVTPRIAVAWPPIVVAIVNFFLCVKQTLCVRDEKVKRHDEFGAVERRQVAWRVA